jgi:hypothetical protein
MSSPTDSAEKPSSSISEDTQPPGSSEAQATPVPLPTGPKHHDHDDDDVEFGA